MAGKPPAKTKGKAVVAKPGAHPNVARRPGAPSTFTQQLGDEICQRMAEGETLTEICRSPGMPAFFSVHRWAERHPEFGEAFARAREAQAHRWAEEVIEISDDSRNDWITRQTERGEEVTVNHEHISRSKLRVDSRKWLLARVLPKTYGDKVEVGGSAENPLTLLIQEVQGRSLKPVQIIPGEAEEE
jgi:hypothetical protein